MEGLFLLVCAFPLIVVLLKTLLKHYGTRTEVNLPPSPPKLPIIGNLHQLGKMPHLSLGKLAEKLGPIIFLQLGEVPTVIVSSAAMAREVMKTHDLAFCSRPQLYSAKWLFYNCTNIVFSPYGAYWRHVRKICILELLSTKRVQSYSFVREDEVSRLVQRIADSCSKPINLTKLLGLYANDVLCRVIFGRSFSEGGEYDQHGFKSMLDEYQELLGGFSIGDYFPSKEFIHLLTGHKSRLQKTFKRFDNFFDKMVQEHLIANRKEEQKDLLDVLLDIQNDGDSEMPLTTDNIKAILLVRHYICHILLLFSYSHTPQSKFDTNCRYCHVKDMFAAGTDTSFITLDWGLTELIMNPKVMKQAREEVKRVVGDKQVVSERDLPQLHYLKAVIKEIFRLHPPVPVLVPRESINAVSIKGYDIPAKTRVFVNAWAIGRDPESWKNPEIFDPDRFVNSSIDFKGQDFELLPFGAGRRGCPGITFGTVTVELALAQLLHSFDWELPPGVEAKDLDLTEAFGISMHKTSDMIAVARPHFA